MKFTKLLPSLFAIAAGIASLQASAIQPSPYFVVADDYIAQHLVTKHETALARFKAKADAVGYKQSWRFYQFDDGRHVAFNAQQSHDYEAQSNEDWEAVAEHFDGEFLAANGAVYQETITKQDFNLIRYSESLSLEPEKASKAPLSHMIFIEIQLHRNAVIRQSLTDWIAQQKQAKDTLYFSTYSKQYGGQLPTMYLAFHAESFIGFYQKLAKKGVFDPVQLLPEAVKKGISEYRISLAKYLPEISY